MKNTEDNDWSEWAVVADGPCDVSNLKIIPKLTRAVSLIIPKLDKPCKEVKLGNGIFGFFFLLGEVLFMDFWGQHLNTRGRDNCSPIKFQHPPFPLS